VEWTDLSSLRARGAIGAEDRSDHRIIPKRDIY
jgi:hypothetical protein